MCCCGVILVALTLILTSCAEADFDNDGWSARQEWQAGTDPQLQDSDGDGIIDSEDSDPLDAAISGMPEGSTPGETPGATPPEDQAPLAPESSTPPVTPPEMDSQTPAQPETPAQPDVPVTPPVSSTPLSEGYLTLNQPHTSRQGMTVTVTGISSEETATAFRYIVSYTLQNETAGSLPEGGFVLHFDSGAPRGQSGFFSRLAAGQSISKSFTVEEAKSNQRQAVDIHYWDSDAEYDRLPDSLTWIVPAS